MATITVSYDGVKLVMSDKGHTNASDSEPVHWHPGDGVLSVANVVAKPNSPVSTEKFWADAPRQNGVNFKGKISDDVVGVWKYDITCDVGTKENSILITEDPKIQVSSR